MSKWLMLCFVTELNAFVCRVFFKFTNNFFSTRFYRQKLPATRLSKKISKIQVSGGGNKSSGLGKNKSVCKSGWLRQFIRHKNQQAGTDQEIKLYFFWKNKQIQNEFEQVPTATKYFSCRTDAHKRRKQLFWSNKKRMVELKIATEMRVQIGGDDTHYPRIWTWNWSIFGSKEIVVRIVVRRFLYQSKLIIISSNFDTILWCVIKYVSKARLSNKNWLIKK